MEVIDRFESPSNYLFEERDATKINVVNNHSMMNELSFYTEGFRLAFSEAERFVERKYSLIHILTPQTKEQLKERFELLESVKIAREKGGVVKRVARKE